MRELMMLGKGNLHTKGVISTNFSPIILAFNAIFRMQFYEFNTDEQKINENLLIPVHSYRYF